MSKIQDFMGKRNVLFWSLLISPWAGFVTQLHLKAPPENIEKINKYRLSNIELVLIHTVLELRVLDIVGKLLVPFVILYKKNSKNIKNLLLKGCSKPNQP